MCSDDGDGTDGGPIETFTDAAIAINLFVIQGHIKATDPEGQMLLDHLEALVAVHEGYMRQGMRLDG